MAAGDVRTPRMIRRGDVVRIKGTDQDEVVRGVQIVLQLANGANDSYSVDESVILGNDTDITPAELVDAAISDAAFRVALVDAREAAANAVVEGVVPQ